MTKLGASWGVIGLNARLTYTIKEANDEPVEKGIKFLLINLRITVCSLL